MKKITNAAEAPKGHHFAIIVFKQDSVYIPGDERSRTCPGHGYHGGNKTFNSFEYMAFDNKAEWEESLSYMILRDPRRTDVMAFEVAKMATFGLKVEIQ